MNAKPGIDDLLIASAIQPELLRRLQQTPDEVFDDFDLTAEEQDILRNPDQRMLRLLGELLSRRPKPLMQAPETPAPAAPLAIEARTLPDMSLALTVVPCAQTNNGAFAGFSYAVWVNPLPDGADPAALPPPAGATLPGIPLSPLHAIVQLSAIQYQDAAGNAQVGLSASLRQSSNIALPPAPESAGNPEAAQAAIAAVRTAAPGHRYQEVVHLMRTLQRGNTGWETHPTNPDIFIAGLGLQTVGQLTLEVQHAIRSSREVFYIDTGVATGPFLEQLCPQVTPLYEESYAEGASRISAYEHMAARVIDAALDHPPVTFALHGHPLVAAHPPFLVLELAHALNLRTAVLPGVSAIDTILADLRIDPVVHGIQMYEATDLLLRRRPLQPEVPAIIWQIGPIETTLHTMHVSRPERFDRFIAHVGQYYPRRHEVVAIHCSPHPLLPPCILRFALEDLGRHAAEIHAGFSLYIPPLNSRPILDHELLANLQSVDHLRKITR